MMLSLIFDGLLMIGIMMFLVQVTFLLMLKIHKPLIDHNIKLNSILFSSLFWVFWATPERHHPPYQRASLGY
jgi:hypothetical protein